MKASKKVCGIVFALSSCLSATLQAQDLYVANYLPYSNGTIGEYGLDGSTVNASLINGLNEPDGIAILGGNLFVANVDYSPITSSSPYNGTIGEYTTSGQTVNASLISGFPPLLQPFGMVISGNQLFVANYGLNGLGFVGELTTSGSTVNASLISVTGGATGIAISGGNLFVANFGTGNLGQGSVGEYTTSGATVNASLITGLTDPTAVAISGNDLFVANLNGTIGEYGLDGSTVNASLISGLHDPYGIAISGNDLFVVNEGTGTIAEYTTSGGTVNAALITGLDNPTAIAVVPEPSSITLCLAGVAILLLSRHCGFCTRETSTP